MKRLGAVEKGALLLACVFVIFGIYTTIHPAEITGLHPGMSYKTGRPDSYPEKITKEKARIYRFLSVAFGMGIGWLVVYRPRK